MHELILLLSKSVRSKFRHILQFMPIFWRLTSKFRHKHPIFANILIPLTKNISHIIEQRFRDKPSFSIEELRQALSGLTDNSKTLSWRIHDLKMKGVIRHLQRGLYSLTSKAEYYADVSKRAKDLFSEMSQQLTYTKLCITETRWLNEFMHHQVFKTYLILEVEKEAREAVFHRVDNQGEIVFLHPTRGPLDTYPPSNDREFLVIKSLPSESPVDKSDGVQVSSLEKMLVDIIADADIYGAQEAEAQNIYRTALEKYNVNQKKLLRYAKRRNKIKEVNDLLKASL